MLVLNVRRDDLVIQHNGHTVALRFDKLAQVINVSISHGGETLVAEYDPQTDRVSINGPRSFDVKRSRKDKPDSPYDMLFNLPKRP